MAIQTIFDNHVPGPVAPKASASGYPAYNGAALTRLSADWVASLLSGDQEVRGSLKRLRARCRQLHNNNDYAQRFVNLIKQNVVGANGIGLEAQIETDADELADQVNDELERGWRKFARRGNCTCDRKLSFRDVLNLALETLIVDGEVFLRKVRGFPNNDFKFALQFIDADQVDTQFNRVRVVDGEGNITNEIKMGVEVDQWNAAVAYWIYSGHPAEGNYRRERIPARDMIHAFVFRRGNQTRGVPWMVSAMSRMNMLGGYEESELVAARIGACKMGFFTSKTGEEYAGNRNGSTGAVEVTLEPGHFDQLPDGVDFKAWDPQHPGHNFAEFVKQMLHGMACGLGVSYTSLAGDLSQVNFSSIRQGVLDERDMWRSLQTFAIDYICQPVYEDFVPVAIATGELKLPPAGLDLYTDAENLRWQPRGWTWVDPLKDVQAAKEARGAGMSSLAKICAQQGDDWRDNIDQIALENEYAKSKGVDLNFTVQKKADAMPSATPDPNAPPVPVSDGEEEQQ